MWEYGVQGSCYVVVVVVYELLPKACGSDKVVQGEDLQPADCLGPMSITHVAPARPMRAGRPRESGILGYRKRASPNRVLIHEVVCKLHGLLYLISTLSPSSITMQ